jgi:D-alanine-D-alanine ligase
VPFTGCGARATALCHKKPVLNAWLASQGLPVPEWIMPKGNAVPADFPLPAIVKPAAEDASVGIDQGSVVTSRKALRQRVAALTEQYDEVIVQRYVAGREVNVGFVGDTVLPLAEIDFSAMEGTRWPIVSFEGKWQPGSADDIGSQPVCPAPLADDLARRIVDVARGAWRAVGGQGYGRVDLRVDAEGRPWLIEVNPNPDLSEDAGLARMARAAGWRYEDLIVRIADTALEAAALAASATALTAGASSRAERRSRKRASQS